MFLNNFYNLLTRYASPKMILLWFISAHVVLLCMMLFTFPEINTQLGAPAFDLRPLGYSVSEANQLLQQLDVATVRLYLFPQLFLLDVLYPLLLALFLSTLMVRLSHLAGKQNTLLVRMGITLPYFAMVFDYSENLLIARMITDPSNVSSGLIKTASTFTVLKGISTTLCWIAVMIMTGMLLVKWSKKHLVKLPK